MQTNILMRNIPMRRAWGITLLAVGTAATATACGVSNAAIFTGASASSSAPASGAAAASYYKDCLGSKVQRPSMISWTCKEAGTSVIQISWSAWDAASATGAGKYIDKAGHANASTVVLGEPDGQGKFTKATLTNANGSSSVVTLR